MSKQLLVEPETEAHARTRRPLCSELRAMSTIDNALCALSEAEIFRVLFWACARYRSHFGPVPPPKDPPPSTPPEEFA